MNPYVRTAGFTGIVLCIVGLVWFIVFRKDTQNPSSPIGSRSAGMIDESDSAPPPDNVALVIGYSDAPVTIIKYGDFLCPICKRFADTTEPQLIAKYIDTRRAKLVFKVDTHIAQESGYAGEGAYCAAEQGKFRQYHDFLYEVQGEYDGYTFERFTQFTGEQLELDRPRFDDCMESHRYQARIEADHAESGRVGGHTTPTFIIGDHKISGAQPLSIFDAILKSQ